jgi:ABC-type polysaccharide/polyol phosphate transport system ATPase subunit
MPAAIEVDGVSKRFRLNTDGVRSFKERAMALGRVRYEDFWALRDIRFEVAEGETVGLLGHNGSGKSTLLKCIGGILAPTTGEIRTRGRVASLLELGAGFHPDLTGRENVFLNASILGISRRDIQRRFDEIVGFAEIEQFIDNQVKHYSSGMYVRLGFAVAVNVDPDVLLIDEVLAVGDESFQRKCLERIHRFQDEGRTIVFVTHAVDQVRQLCHRAVVLDHGNMVALGDPPEAIRTFRDHLYASRRQREAAELGAGDEPIADQAETAGTGDGTPDAVTGDAGAGAGTSAPAGTAQPSHGEMQEQKRNLRVRIVEVELAHDRSDERAYLLPGESLTVWLHFRASRPTSDVVFGIAVYDASDGKELFGANTDVLGVEVPEIKGDGVVEFRFAAVPLLDGTYPLSLGIHSHDHGTVYDWQEQRHWFTVMNPTRTVGAVALPLEVTVKV